ncbi:ATP-binding protein [Streptomyces sp. NPDC049954]|uniref:ATP-binding protein n=1 Tax=Streptomyces sp. NPDC049954 TaxID=3155779 RepID=UPI0034342642
METLVPLAGFRREVTVRPEDLAALRRLVAGVVSRWCGAELAREVALCAHELLANVERHTEAGDCVLTLGCDADTVRLVVADGEGVRPCLVTPGDTAEGGRGLLMVAGIAARWGVDLDADGRGKSVWAEFDCRQEGGS